MVKLTKILYSWHFQYGRFFFRFCSFKFILITILHETNFYLPVRDLFNPSTASVKRLNCLVYILFIHIFCVVFVSRNITSFIKLGPRRSFVKDVEFQFKVWFDQTFKNDTIKCWFCDLCDIFGHALIFIYIKIYLDKHCNKLIPIILLGSFLYHRL